MSNRTVRNPIAVQDWLINRLASLDQSGATYPTLRTKATRKAREEMLDFGLSQNMTEQMLYDALDMVALIRLQNQVCSEVANA